MEPTDHRLSVIVVSYNEEINIPRLKSSVDRLRMPAGLTVETILVDGGSRDGSADLGRQLHFSKIIVLEGASIPVCRNRGIREATGDWLAFVDADCEVAPDWLEQASPFLEGSREILIGWPASPPDPMTWVQQAWHAHWTHKNAKYESCGSSQVIRREGFRLITTRNLLMTREAVDRLGGFDEQLSTGEDTDLCFRAYQAGIPTLAVPALRVIHYGEPKSLREFFRQQLWHANRSSYGRIVRESGRMAGGHAPLFSIAFALAFVLFVAGLIANCAGHHGIGTSLLLPLPILLLGPALVLACRARRLRLVVPLAVLYGAYGCARAMDLLGFFRTKRSWKSKP